MSSTPKRRPAHDIIAVGVDERGCVVLAVEPRCSHVNWPWIGGCWELHDWLKTGEDQRAAHGDMGFPDAGRSDLRRTTTGTRQPLR